VERFCSLQPTFDLTFYNHHPRQHLSLNPALWPYRKGVIRQGHLAFKAAINRNVFASTQLSLDF
jgi:hypothetical protein